MRRASLLVAWVAQRTKQRARNRRAITIGLALVFAAGYLFTLQSYRAMRSEEFRSQQPPLKGLNLVVVPAQVDGQARSVTGTVVLEPGAEMADEQGRLRERLTVQLDPATENANLVFKSGYRPSPQAVTIPVAGLVQGYPFDSYTFMLTAIAMSGPLTAERPVDCKVLLDFQVPGWSFSDGSGQLSAAVDPTEIIVGRFRRSSPTMVLAVLLAGLLLALAVLAVALVRSMARGGVPREMSLGSWLTGMLFALVPIRLAMPGAPPVGDAALDMLVFLWVEATILTCVILVAVSILAAARDRAIAAALREADARAGAAGRDEEVGG